MAISDFHTGKLKCDQYNYQEINTFLAKSVILHISVFALFFAFSKYLGNLDQSTRYTNIRLAESSVLVDIVAMPKFTIQEKIKISTQLKKSTPESDITQKKITTGPELRVKQKKLSFAEMLKKLSQKKIKQKKPKIQKNAATSTIKENNRYNNKEISKLLHAGNILKQGSALTDANSSDNNQEFAQYHEKLKNAVKPQWKLPSFLINQNLQCRIRIFLTATGRLINAKIYESSGNDEYDNRALAAVRLTLSFPPLPKNVISLGIKGKFLLGFPL